MSKKKKPIIAGVRTYGEFLTILSVCSEEYTKELLERLDQSPCPAFVRKIQVPSNLNTLTYGQLDDLSRSASSRDPFAECFEILLGVKQKDVYSLSVFDVFGFCNFVKRELERINKLFSDIEVKHNSDEISAGVKELNFGSFGVIDWYARRMGITNQDEVYGVGWIRIYTCMKNDAAQNNYERRLHEQAMKKAKRH